MKQLLFILFVLFASHSSAQTDPSIDWKELNTPHFRIIYNAKYRELANLYAQYAEQSHLMLEGLYRETPSLTTLMLVDNTDVANAFATSLPYPFMNAYTVFPSPSDSISSYDNWGFELIAHEYAHILTFEPTHGLITPLRWIFGSIARPNFLLPRWFHEGVSVNAETYVSENGGRLRSPQEFGDLRAMFLSNQMSEENMARLNEAIPDWYGGRRPYTLGALVINEAVREKGSPDVIRELVQSYSRRLPFFINGPVEDQTGKSFQALLDQSYTRLQGRAEDQAQQIKAAGSRRGAKLQQKGEYNHSPRISPDGNWLAYVGRYDHSEQFVTRQGFQNNQINKDDTKILFHAKRISRLNWTRDSNTLIFDDLDTFERYNLFSDIFEYNISDKKRKRITTGARAQDPALSPDETKIVFRQNYEMGTRISLVERDGENLRVLYTPPHEHRVSNPEFVSDQIIVFSERDTHSKEILKVLNLNKMGEPSEALANYSPIQFTRRTNHGLIFQSSASGVPNLYLASFDLRKVKAVTNTTTQALNGDLHPVTKDLIYSDATAEGPRLFQLKFAQWNTHPNPPPKVEPLIEDLYADGPKRPEVATQYESEDYSALPYMWPRYWIPLVFAVEEGMIFQALTGSQDPTGQHIYGLSGMYDTLTDKVGFSASYQNNSTPVSLTFAGGRFHEYIYSGGFERTSDYRLANGTFFLPGFSSSWRGGLGAIMNRVAFANIEFNRAGPQAFLSYSDVSQRGHDITPRRGSTLNLSHTKFLESWGNLGYDESQISTSTFFSKWLPERHGLALMLRGTFAPNNPEPLLGATTVSGNYEFSLSGSSNLMRGYPSGVLLGKSLANGNLEYRFPISRHYRGSGTFPLFVNRTHGALFVDATSVDGYAFNFEQNGFQRSRFGDTFYSAGAEWRIDLTVAYNVPAQLFLGLYYGFDKPAGGGFSPFFGFIF